MTAHSRPVVEEHRKAFVAYLSVPKAGTYLLNFGPGDSTCERWEISREQLANIIKDGLPHVVG